MRGSPHKRPSSLTRLWIDPLTASGRDRRVTAGPPTIRQECTPILKAVLPGASQRYLHVALLLMERALDRYLPVKVPGCEKRRATIYSSGALEQAKLESAKSPDPVTKVGCVIVRTDGEIVGRGHNSMPRGCETISWRKSLIRLFDKGTYVVHAEQNAIYACLGKTHGCSIYTTLFPCNECAKAIIQTGIREVFYSVDRVSWKMFASKMMLRLAGIPYTQVPSIDDGTSNSPKEDCKSHKPL